MYSGYAYKVAMDIGRRIAKSFRVVREYDHLFDHWPCRLRMNKYSFTCGVQLHANPGFLTILLQVEIVGGLEVVDDKSGEFVAVDPRPGTLLVNVGDAAKHTTQPPQTTPASPISNLHQPSKPPSSTPASSLCLTSQPHLQTPSAIKASFLYPLLLLSASPASPISNLHQPSKRPSSTSCFFSKNKGEQ
ncbi:hypothetical protein FEM48_Zijuj08G0073500 [Ziziphus jujuba var. spinosa]|uniref:Isopenicillin N synthase-like Fe(2+) 2OG dioxygenase domain-containing protein n=1 Tax=Ziziphus jujuba var. spinosa TaxID=714518 RepID=A0A978UXR4_ZIZJJ|nr:hypothetical protein FEM48_Zijuj08G0073500 [Ziziphus jujuba var. spinosa]